MLYRARKYLKKQFGHSAPQLTVRARMPKRLKLGIAAIGLALVGTMIWSGFDYGRILAGFNVGKIEEERKQMTEDIARLSEENAVLKKLNVQFENEAKIAVGAKDAISGQLLKLQTEVTQLREDVSFFQKLTAGSVKENALSIQKLQVQKEPDGNAWRVRALVAQGGSGNGEFRGNLQLTLNVQQDGKRSNIVLPEEQKDVADSLKLAFKTYQRVEAVVRVPAGAEVKSIQAKLFANGTPSPRAQMNVTL
jgi:hypothetical protein